MAYTGGVPKIWTDTIDSHRTALRGAALDVVDGLVAAHGLRSVTMSQIAAETGIGRATIYKHFPDLEAILVAWHERQISRHFQQLAGIANRSDSARGRLEAVLEAYALITYKQRHDSDLHTLLHRGDYVARAHGRLRDFIRDLLAEGVKSQDFRDDVAPDELANYCLNALKAARTLPSKAAVHRLVKLTLSGLSPPC